MKIKKRIKFLIIIIVSMILSCLCLYYYFFVYHHFPMISNYTNSQYHYKMKLVDKSIDYCNKKMIVQLEFFEDPTLFITDDFSFGSLYLTFDPSTGNDYKFSKGVYIISGMKWQKISTLTGQGVLTSSNAGNISWIKNLHLTTEKILANSHSSEDFLGHEIFIKSLKFGNNYHSVNTFLCPDKTPWQEKILEGLELE